MIKEIKLTKKANKISIIQPTPFEKINIISAKQIKGEFILNPMILIAISNAEGSFTLHMNLDPITLEFNCFDVLEKKQKMNYLPDFKTNLLDISINRIYYKGHFSIELELEIA